jgi:hypothetical protein
MADKKEKNPAEKKTDSKTSESEKEEVSELEERIEDVDDESLENFLKGKPIIDIAPDVKMLGDERLEEIQELQQQRVEKDNKEDKQDTKIKYGTSVDYLSGSQDESKYSVESSNTRIEKFDSSRNLFGMRDDFEIPKFYETERDDYHTQNDNYKISFIEERKKKKDIPF